MLICPMCLSPRVGPSRSLERLLCGECGADWNPDKVKASDEQMHEAEAKLRAKFTQAWQAWQAEEAAQPGGAES